VRLALKRLLNGRIVILLIAILTTVIVLLIPEEEREGLPFWTTRPQHYDSFAPTLNETKSTTRKHSNPKPCACFKKNKTHSND